MKNFTFDVKVADLVCAALFVALVLIAGYITTTWLPPVLPGDPGAAFFPRIALAVIFIFGLVLLINSVRAVKAEAGGERQTKQTVSIDLWQFAATFFYSILLIAGIGYAGFELSTFAFLLFLLGRRSNRWVWAVITSVISVAIMYLVFIIVLKVRLPLMFLPNYIEIW